jgi:hypothetical protein
MKKPIKNHQRKLLAEMAKVLKNLTNTVVAERIELRNAVCEYVEVEHARGTPIQKVIEIVTQILREAELEAGHASEELARQLVDWCLEFHSARTLTTLPQISGTPLM